MKKWKSLCLNRNEMEGDLEAICTTEHRPEVTLSARYIPMMKAANSSNLTHKVSIFERTMMHFLTVQYVEKEDQRPLLSIFPFRKIKMLICLDNVLNQGIRRRKPEIRRTFGLKF